MQSTHATEEFDTIVVGGGQAGLAVGYYLAKQDRAFVVLDAQARSGDSWRNRWDSLQVFTPAKYSNLPGMRFPKSAGFLPSKNEVADYLEAYVIQFELPVRLHTRADSLTREGQHYVATAGTRRFEADHVVVATGAFQTSNEPEFAPKLDPEIVRFHSSAYRNPDQLQNGDVLVVGAGNSGTQIAMELATSHRVWLSGPSHGHLPRRIFGLDIFWWLKRTGLLTLRMDSRAGRFLAADPSRGDPLVGITGEDLAAVRRVPRTVAVEGGRPVLDDGRILDVANAVWCTGFKVDFRWISLPVFRDDGYPTHYRGVATREPGLYFIGLRYLHRMNSSLIGGVGADAEYIAQHIAST